MGIHSTQSLGKGAWGESITPRGLLLEMGEECCCGLDPECPLKSHVLKIRSSLMLLGVVVVEPFRDGIKRKVFRSFIVYRRECGTQVPSSSFPFPPRLWDEQVSPPCRSGECCLPASWEAEILEGPH